MIPNGALAQFIVYSFAVLCTMYCVDAKGSVSSTPRRMGIGARSSWVGRGMTWQSDELKEASGAAGGCLFDSRVMSCAVVKVTSIGYWGSFAAIAGPNRVGIAVAENSQYETRDDSTPWV